MSENTYNSKCSADLVLRLTSPVQGVIEAGLTLGADPPLPGVHIVSFFRVFKQ